jgi:hypothetical protein
MEDLITNPEVKGAALVNEIRSRMQDAGVDAILETVRTINIGRSVLEVKSLNFGTVFEVAEHLRKGGLTVEDCREVLLGLEIAGAKTLSESDILNLFYKFLDTKPVKPSLWARLKTLVGGMASGLRLR